jgi:hypothetical protein
MSITIVEESRLSIASHALAQKLIRALGSSRKIGRLKCSSVVQSAGREGYRASSRCEGGPVAILGPCTAATPRGCREIQCICSREKRNVSFLWSDVGTVCQRLWPCGYLTSRTANGPSAALQTFHPSLSCPILNIT